MTAGMPGTALGLGAAAALWLLAAALGLTTARRVGLVTSAAASSVGGLAALLGGVGLLLRTQPLAATLGAGHLVGGLSLRATPLAGVFVALLGLVALAIGWFAPRYHQARAATAPYLVSYNLALLASLGLLVAGNVTTFLVAWESMALLCYLLVLRHHRRPGVARGGFWFLALSEAGFVLIIAAFALMAARTGSLDFATIAARAPTVPIGTRSAAFLLALIGFGFKAGLVPLHVWLPEAHPVAPADGSAFLSGLVVKLGVYGILLFAFELLGTGPAWWGLLTMGLGALTAVLGILYALTERDLKRFLAYSTIENIGVIITAAGAAMTFGSFGQAALAAFLLLTALYHVANHGTYKTLLFLEAGRIEHATGTRDMDRLGGLIKRMPRGAAIALVGTMGIAALPPLNGFVSEWLIFQGLFQGFRIPSHPVGILVVVAGAALGLTAGLAVAAFVRAFGIPYLGMPRTRAAAEATEKGQPIAGPALLAAACVALGIGAPLVLVALERAVHTTTGTSIRAQLLIENLTVIPAHTDFSAFSPTYLAVFLVAVSSVPLLIYVSGRPRGASALVPVWDGGIVAFKPRMQYSAMTFAAPNRVTFAQLYRPTVRLERASDDPAGRSGPVHYEAEVTPIFQRYLYRPVIAAVEWLADLARPIQSGDVNLYLLYVFVTVLIAYLVSLA
jgi:hydrogenase-4 component B